MITLIDKNNPDNRIVLDGPCEEYDKETLMREFPGELRIDNRDGQIGLWDDKEENDE